MKLTFVGTNSGEGNCPAVYETDRGTVVIQGWQVDASDAEAWEAIKAQGLATNENAVEIPRELLQYIPRA